MIYEFRPTPSYFNGGFRRFADGRWIEDDGEYDLAFIGNSGAPICLYFQPNYRANIICSWLSTHWSAKVARHPNGNAWHYATRDGTPDWGATADHEYFNGANRLAGDSGMSKLCGEFSCANGRHVEFKANDKHIAAGLLREKESKLVFRWPHDLKCCYCGDPVQFAAEAA